MRKLAPVLTMAAACLAALVLVPRSAEGQTTPKGLVVRINGMTSASAGSVTLTRLVSSISSTGTTERRVDIYTTTSSCRVHVSSFAEAIELREQITSPATTKITCIGTPLVQGKTSEAVVRTFGSTQGHLEIQ